MGLAKQLAVTSVGEYLRLESRAEQKHEYIDGEIIAMAGGTARASFIAAKVIRHLGNVLEGKPCRVYTSDLRVRVARRAFLTYPDASVICGPVQFDPDDPAGTTVLNPRVIVEVLSPSTEAYDRGEKFKRYRRIASLDEYVIVSQDTPRIEVFQKARDGSWVLREFEGMRKTAALKSIRAKLPLSKVFSGVEFDDA
jgi:Uma2 family endonuclease